MVFLRHLPLIGSTEKYKTFPKSCQERGCNSSILSIKINRSNILITFKTLPKGKQSLHHLLGLYLTEYLIKADVGGVDIKIICLLLEEVNARQIDRQLTRQFLKDCNHKSCNG